VRSVFERLACRSRLGLQLALDQLLDHAVIPLGGSGGIACLVELLMGKLARSFAKSPSERSGWRW
jgi:hypothetical protein